MLSAVWGYCMSRAGEIGALLGGVAALIGAVAGLKSCYPDGEATASSPVVESQTAVSNVVTDQVPKLELYVDTAGKAQRVAEFIEQHTGQEIELDLTIDGSLSPGGGCEADESEQCIGMLTDQSGGNESGPDMQVQVRFPKDAPTVYGMSGGNLMIRGQFTADGYLGANSGTSFYRLGAVQ